VLKAVQAAVWKDRVDGFIRAKGSQLACLPVAPWLRFQSFCTEYNAIVCILFCSDASCNEPRGLYHKRVQKGKLAFAKRRAFQLGDT
jgi:hypothetical protein